MPSKKKIKQPPITTITPARLKRMRKSVNRCWLKLNRQEMPPHDMRVLARCQLGKKVNVYVGMFEYGKDSLMVVKLNGCNHPIPASAWKTEGLTHWMTIPD